MSLPTAFVRCSNGHICAPKDLDNCPFCRAGLLTARPDSTGHLPVGWLVVLSGRMAGTDLALRQGRNWIAESSGGEWSAQTNRPTAAIPKGVISCSVLANAFLFELTSDTGEISVNGRRVFPHTLLAGDKLQIGLTSLIFIPLVGEQFRWT